MSTVLQPPVRVPVAELPIAPVPRTQRWWVRPGRPAWALPAQAGVGVLALVLYTWDLSVNGLGNSFYAAAVRSGSENWKAFLFGSLDPANSITVDKPPAALWVQDLTVRLFGFSSWSLLLPEALAGVASVLVLYHLVRRWMGEVAAVLASLALALTPVAVLMFRFNNPDALLTLLLLLAAWALWSALETAKTNRLVLCGGLLGLAFTTKMLQGFVVLPAFALVYLWAGPPAIGRRVVQLLWGGVALVVSSGWWVALVELWPAGSRPYVGGSTDNSELNLIFGYNGFGRLLGSGNGPGGGGGGSPFGGPAGLLRMFNSVVGGEVSWLIPLALVGLVGGLVWAGRAARTDRGRAGFVLWGGWTMVTAAVFSDTQGIFHPYYTVGLAPGVAALAGGGAVALWRLGRRADFNALFLPAGIVATGVWAATLLGRTPGYHSGLGTVILIGSIASAAVLGVAMTGLWSLRGLTVVAGVVAAACLLAGPAAYAATTIGQSAGSGGNPEAGPAQSGAGAFGPGPGGGARFGGGAPSGGGATAPAGLVSYLEAHRDGASYLAAVDGSQNADSIIIATGDPVLAMGGFTGSDPWPTLSAFKQLVANGEVHYVLVGGGGGPGGGRAGSGLTARTNGAPSGSGFGGSGPGAANFGPPGAELGGPPGGFGGRAGGGPSLGGGPGGGQSTVAAVDAWVESHGTEVSSSAYGGSAGGTLYYVSSATAR